MGKLIAKLRGEHPEPRPEAPVVTVDNLEEVLASGFEWITNSYPGEDRDLGDLMDAPGYYSYLGELRGHLGDENVATGIPLKDGKPMGPDEAGDSYGVYVRRT